MADSLDFNEPAQPGQTGYQTPGSASYKFVYHKPTDRLELWGQNDRFTGPTMSMPYNKMHHGDMMDAMGIPEEEQWGDDTVPGYCEAWDAGNFHAPPTPVIAIEDARGGNPEHFDPELHQRVMDEFRKREPAIVQRYEEHQQRTAAVGEGYPLLGQPGWKPGGGGIGQNTFDWLNQNKPNEQFGHESDCINPKCQHNWTPEEQLELSQHGEIRCPVCGTQQTMYGTEGPFNEDTRDQVPGKGGTRSGLDRTKMGQIGETLVQRLGNLPCGQITHHFGALQYNNPVDFTTVDEHSNPWGVEVKAIDARSQPRFKLGGAGEVAKKAAYCAQHGLRPAVVGVRLNFATDDADIFFLPKLTDPYIGVMQHVGSLNFADLNPFRDPATGQHTPLPPPVEDDLPF